MFLCKNMTNLVCENILRDVDLVLMTTIYKMRYKNETLQGFRSVLGNYNQKQCEKCGPNNPRQWQKWCFICKQSNKNKWTIFGPSFKGNFKTYCICKGCAQNSEDYLISQCVSYENEKEEIMLDFM